MLTSSLPPFPVYELESTLEIIKCGTLPRSLGDLGRGSSWGWEAQERALTAWVVGVSHLTYWALGTMAGMC